MPITSVELGPECVGERLDKALAAALPEISRARLKGLIDEGCVRLDGGVTRDGARRLTAPARLEVEIPPPRPARPAGEAMDLDILFEDASIIVINKPPGLVVHPGAGNPDHTLVNALIAHCGASLSGIGGEARPGIVHRLDKDTSGVMVAAKTDAAHRALAAQFETRDISRLYHALVGGVPSPLTGTIDGAIGRSPQNRRKMAVRESGGKPARTHYDVLARYGRATGGAALLACRLETGRTHQIRVHLAHIGHGVIGDPLYGRTRSGTYSGLGPEAGEAARGFGRQALHALELTLVHPVTGARHSFTGEYPLDFRELKEKLESG